MRAEHELAIKEIMEAGLAESSLLKSRIRFLEGQVEDIEKLKASKSADEAEIRNRYEAREEKARQEFDTILQRMRENLEAV